MTQTAAIALFSLLAAIAAAIGIAAFVLWPGAARRGGAHLEAAAGGALLVMGLVLLAPEALHLSPYAWMAILAGAALGAGLHRGAVLLSGPRAGTITLLSGLGLHSLLDGAAFTASLATSPVFGLGSAIGLVLHDAPKALFAFVLLRRAGLGPAGAAAGAMLTAAGLTALGAFGAAPVADAVSDGALGMLAGLAAGLLIYSGAACLRVLRAPSAAGETLRGKALAALAGAAAIWALGLIGHH